MSGLTTCRKCHRIVPFDIGEGSGNGRPHFCDDCREPSVWRTLWRGLVAAAFAALAIYAWLVVHP